MRLQYCVPAAILLGLFWSELSDAQLRQDTGPCTDLPELGSLLETHVTSTVTPAPGDKSRYSWRITLLPGSQRTAISVVLRDAAGDFAGPANWGALSGISDRDRRAGAVFSTRTLDTDTDDLRAPNTYEFSAISDRLPAPTIAIIYPRRPTCEPTSEEWPALRAKGWTPEKFARLHRRELYTNREIVLAPVLVDTGESSSILFAKAMRRLADLHQYLAPLAEGERSRRLPAPPQDAGEYAGLSLHSARQRAIEQAGSRPQDVALIDALFEFYRARR